MPNRRRRRLSTATSAVAALAVVSPFAYSAISDMAKPAPQPREFRSAAMVTDLPDFFEREGSQTWIRIGYAI